MASALTRFTGSLVAAATLGSVALVGAAAPASAATTTGTTAAVQAATSTRVASGERNTKVSRSLTGVRPSAYIGKYFNPRYERTRKCIVRKESGGNYRIASRTGKYQGAYQFGSPLARAAAIKMGRKDLVGKPIRTWSRFDQDKAFWVIWNNGKGASHWPTRRGC